MASKPREGRLGSGTQDYIGSSEPVKPYTHLGCASPDASFYEILEAGGRLVTVAEPFTESETALPRFWLGS